MPLTDNQLNSIFGKLYRRFLHADKIKREKLFLAHYTSLEAIENILTHNEIWFSNPLFMNDLEELRWGLRTGNDLLQRTNYARRCFSTGKSFNAFETLFSRLIHQWELGRTLRAQKTSP